MSKSIFATEEPRHGRDQGRSFKYIVYFFGFSMCLCVSAVSIIAQEAPPTPGPPKTVSVPAVKETKLSNGLTVAVVERHNVPLVTVNLLVRSGAANEDASKAGLADLTASMLTKGTKTRSATDIAEQVEFLGGSINSGAGWNSSSVGMTVTSDKLDKAMEILADVVLNPSFSQDELDLLKSQTLDELKFNLKQPGFLASYVASKYSFGEHPAGGTPASVGATTRNDIVAFHATYFRPERSVLIFTGDVTMAQAAALAKNLFGLWRGPSSEKASAQIGTNAERVKGSETPGRILVLDLPNSGQASVSYQRIVNGIGRTSPSFYPSSVLNSVLGGGYSSRLNQEIRIKRGLSYGAGSGFGWRSSRANFATRTQTKNESAAEVAELVLAEVKKLGDASVAEAELVPRKSVLTGNFDRNLETTGGLANAVADLYSFGIPTSELNAYVNNVNSVSDTQIRSFAGENLLGGDIIIVGDYSIFKDDLAKRFPNTKIDVLKADELDLAKDGLRK
jgi:zinc protease